MTTFSLDALCVAAFGALLAAQARQLFRAVAADDRKAIEEGTFQFLELVVSFLPRHLSQDVRWGGNDSFLDCMKGAPLTIVPAVWLHVADKVCVMFNDPQAPKQRPTGYICHQYEPFEFEMQLCPRSGILVGYAMRFGARSHFTDGCAYDNKNDGPGEWAFSFRHGDCLAPDEARRVYGGGLRHLHPDGRVWTTPFEQPDIGENAANEYDDSAVGTMTSHCELIGVYARQLQRAYAAQDQEAVDLSIRGLHRFVRSAMSFQERTRQKKDQPTRRPDESNP
jgi:hypothetical protein